jgi:Sulfotransferase family
MHSTLATPRSSGTSRRLPWRVRALHRLDQGLSHCGLHPVHLSAAALMAAAQRRTGLSAWGDEVFRQAFQRLLVAYEHTAQLHLLGRLALRQECLRLLSNQLRIQDDLQRFPRIAQTPVRKPLVIVGLPRTGTTLLHHLLAQAPAARVPRLWELLQPSPPPCLGATAPEPRIKRAEQMLRQALALAPDFPAIHPLSATGPEECIFLFQNTFMSVVFEAYSEVPEYMAWLLHQDLTPAYQFYKQQLQVLQWRWPGTHWVLKAPHHLFFLDVLLTVFPDVCVVHTHRDPSTAMASLCSLMATARRFYSHRVVDQRLGAPCLATWGTALDRMLHVRAAADPARFYDLQYEDLLADPLDAVHRIYAYFGYTAAPGMDTGMRQWLATHPQHQHGVHQYALSHFGLDRATIEQRCAAYIQRFHVSTSPRA